jgi:uncharacterized protein with GYD domain
MPKYMIQASYTAEGLKGLHKDKASGRREAVSQAIAALGGKLEVLYYSFGQHDVALIAEMPDNASMTALCMAVSASGLVRTHTTTLMTVEETDQALSKTVDYRAPGKGR